MTLKYKCINLRLLDFGFFYNTIKRARIMLAIVKPDMLHIRSYGRHVFMFNNNKGGEAES